MLKEDKDKIENTIIKYLNSFYINDFEEMISIIDENELKKYVADFISFAHKMDEFGETDDFLYKIGIENLEILKNTSSKAFIEKILALTKQEIGNKELDRLIKKIEIIDITYNDKLAVVKYSFPVSYFGNEEIITSSVKLSKKEDNWFIHFKSNLDNVLKSFQEEIDVFKERKSKDQIHNLNHNVNDLEKITLVGYKNMNGKVVFEPRFKDGGDFSYGLAYVKVISKYGYIDKTGKIVIKPKYKSAKNFSENLAGIQSIKSHKWGFINKKGKLKIDEQFDDVSEFNEGLCAVAINGKWGYINKKGKIKIECQYDEANEFWSGEAEVVLLDKKNNYQTLYINTKGKIIDE